MRISNKSNALLYEKGLYAKQLESFADLCKTYRTLARIRYKQSGEYSNSGMPQDFSDFEKINEFYKPYFERALNGENSFSDELRRKILTPSQVKHITKYTQLLKKSTLFKKASEQFDKAYFETSTSKKEFSFNDEEFDKYERMISRRPSLRNFNDFIDKNPKAYIGYYFCKTTLNAYNEIKKINPKYIESLPSFENMINPKTFGATITGFSGRLKNKAITTFKANKKVIASALIASTLFASTLGTTVTHLNNVDKMNNARGTTNSQHGYSTSVSRENLSRIESIRMQISELKHSPFLASRTNDLSEIRGELDLLISDIFSDLVTSAIKEKYPDFTNIQVTNEYDLNNPTEKNILPKYNQDNTRFVHVSAINGNGERVETNYTLSSISLFDNGPLYESLNDEITLDGVKRYERGAELIDLFSSLKSVAITQDEKNTNIRKILRIYEGILDNTDHLAGVRIIIGENNTLVATYPQTLSKSSRNTNPEIDVDERY